jgi:hypothetical protein
MAGFKTGALGSVPRRGWIRETQQARESNCKPRSFSVKPGILAAVSIWYGYAKTDRVFRVYHPLRSVSSDRSVSFSRGPCLRFQSTGSLIQRLRARSMDGRQRRSTEKIQTHFAFDGFQALGNVQNVLYAVQAGASL